MSNKFAKTRGVLIILSIAAFIAGMICIVFATPPISYILLFTAFGCMMCGLGLTFTKQEDTLEEADDRLSESLLLEQENVRLQQRIEALEMDITEKDTEIEETKRSFEVERIDLNNRYDELKRKLTGKEAEQSSEALLPPIERNENENETIDIIKIANDTIKYLEPFSKRVGLNVSVSTSEEKLLVRGNTSRMKILFRNIIDNSIKYMNQRGNLLITISNIGDDIFIVLKDSGNGLSEDETKHIFELNYQGSNRISGNGLGLTQAKAIVEYYGGTIYAKSNVGRGMGIYIQLPTT